MKTTDEWIEESQSKPEEGAVLGIKEDNPDLPVTVIYVPPLGWYEISSSGRYLEKVVVKFWKPYNLPK